MRATPTGQASSVGPQLPPVTPATGGASLGHHMPAASGHQPRIKRGVTGDGGSVSGRINKGSAALTMALVLIIFHRGCLASFRAFKADFKLTTGLSSKQLVPFKTLLTHPIIAVSKKANQYITENRMLH